MNEVKIYTDGACSGNPGAGGYGIVLQYMGHEKCLSGGSVDTTNNRMELTGVIEGLKALKRPCKVILYSDSKYIIDAITKKWVYKWKSNGWMRGKNSPAQNSDLWKELLPLLEVHDVEFVWVKGHAGHRENEICDSLAVKESMKYKNL